MSDNQGMATNPQLTAVPTEKKKDTLVLMHCKALYVFE